MDKLDRVQKLHRILTSRRFPVPIRVLANELECTERNVHRIIQRMQMFQAPIEYDKSLRGWHYEDDPENHFELPGLWLTAEELQSLSLLLSILKGFESSTLSETLKPIEQQIYKLLESRDITASTFVNHIKALPIGNRYIDNSIFNKVAEAALKQQRISIHYKSYNHKITQRTLSPQNIIYYRDNWYLDAWCHLRESLRTFSIARIEQAEPTKISAKKINPQQLAEHYSSSYGIFAGKASHTAKLRFSPAVARETASQQWHPSQQGEWEGNEYLLTIPYAESKELIQDLLRYTPNVYVESPVKLRKALQNKLQQGLELQLDRGLGVVIEPV